MPNLYASAFSSPGLLRSSRPCRLRSTARSQNFAVRTLLPLPARSAPPAAQTQDQI
eukprot:COSAG04_NODE_28184_length_277_cov_0.758427_1_plen_55_part_10